MSVSCYRVDTEHSKTYIDFFSRKYSLENVFKNNKFYAWCQISDIPWIKFTVGYSLHLTEIYRNSAKKSKE